MGREEVVSVLRHAKPGGPELLSAVWGWRAGLEGVGHLQSAPPPLARAPGAGQGAAARCWGGSGGSYGERGAWE